MATRGAIAEMEDNARKRIDVASAALAASAGVDVPVVAYEKKPELRMLRHLEAQADFLDALAAQFAAPKPEPKARAKS
jgi:hypothetical protein